MKIVLLRSALRNQQVSPVILMRQSVRRLERGLLLKIEHDDKIVQDPGGVYE